MNGGLTGFGMMGQATTGMGASGPVVGPDGTAYALRKSVASTGMMGVATGAGTDLVAINPADGTARWTLRVNGYMLSEPILAPDGNISHGLGTRHDVRLDDWNVGAGHARGFLSEIETDRDCGHRRFRAHRGPGGD